MYENHLAATRADVPINDTDSLESDNDDDLVPIVPACTTVGLCVEALPGWIVRRDLEKVHAMQQRRRPSEQIRPMEETKVEARREGQQDAAPEQEDVILHI